jgi:heme exporter protein D
VKAMWTQSAPSLVCSPLFLYLDCAHKIKKKKKKINSKKKKKKRERKRKKQKKKEYPISKIWCGFFYD